MGEADVATDVEARLRSMGRRAYSRQNNAPQDIQALPPKAMNLLPYQQEGLCRCGQMKALEMGKVTLDYLDGSRVITRVPVRGSQEGQCQRENM